MKNFLYIARLTMKDDEGRLLRKLGRHPSLTKACEYAYEKFGKTKVSSVMISKKELDKRRNK